MQEIVPGLFLGDYADSQNYPALQSNGITHVVAALRQIYPTPANITLHRVEVDDLETSDLLSHFQSCCTFIRTALSKKEKVLIHCQAGVSRSVTILVAYLLQEKICRTTDEAVQLIRRKRPQAEPSSTFMNQLEIWERTGCEWNPETSSEQRRFLMDCMTSRVREGASPASLLASYPSPLVSASNGDTAEAGSSARTNEASNLIQGSLEIAALNVTAERTATTGEKASAAKSNGSDVVVDGRTIRCKMCRRELAGRSHVLDHERGIGQHAFAPRRRDIAVYRAEQERNRAEEQAEDRRLIKERLTAEAAAASTASSPAADVKVYTARPPPISMSVPVPAVAPPPIIKLTTAVPGLRISRPFNPSTLRTPVARPSALVATPANSAPANNTTSTPPSQISLADRTGSIASASTESPSPVILAPPESPLLPSHLCSSYYVEPLGWMSPTLESGILSGRLVCPNTKCNAKLGSFDWAGLQCSCGAWVCPGFALNVSKVDEVSLRH